MNLTEAARILFLDNGWTVFRVNSGRVKSSYPFVSWWLPADRKRRTTGVSDLIAFKEGDAIFAEIKEPGDVIKPDQRSFLQAMRENGFCAVSISDLKPLADLLAVFDYVQKNERVFFSGSNCKPNLSGRKSDSVGENG